MIALIVAMSENKVIGKDNKLLWHLPNDFKFFKNKTVDNTVIMGRKTFDSIGKALPNRKNIVISRNSNLKIQDTEVVSTYQDALFKSSNEVFIIGGAEIYKMFLPIITDFFITVVHTEIDGDTKVDFIPFDKLSLKSEKKCFKDNKHKFDYSFMHYQLN